MCSTVASFDFLFPDDLMQQAELRQARRYLVAIARQRSLRKELNESSSAQFSKTSSLLAAAEAKLERLAAEVLLRELGLERYMVLHVHRHGGFEAKFQVLQLSVTNDFGRKGQWGWMLEGRSLNKNGKLGSKGRGVGFNIARIERRKLDGSWVRLKLRSDDELGP